MFSQRKGQVFLLVTILVISFMIGISSVLLDVQRSDYLEPAPDAFQTYEAWEVTHNSLIDIMDIYLAQSTGSSGEPSTIDPQLTDLSQYLSNRGITNSIEIVSVPAYTPVNDVLTSIETASVSAEFSIYLSSVRGTVIEQNLVIDISYTLDVDQANTAIFYKTINGEEVFLVGANLTNTGTASSFQDNGNGSYDHSVAAGETITATSISTVTVSAETI